MSSVPVLRFSHLSEAQRRAYVIADNRLAELAGWDRELIELLPPERKDLFLKTQEADFSFAYGEQARFRGNAYFERGSIGVALRLIPRSIRTIAELKLPPILETFAAREQGFFLVVGPVGQGKTTTLAALIEKINSERSEHIVTIEDPIEYLFENKKSLVEQREVRVDTVDFLDGTASDVVVETRMATAPPPGSEGGVAPGAPLAPHVEGAERGDDPVLERADIGAHVGTAAAKVEHQIAHALTWPVIGELPATARAMHRKTRVDEIGVAGRCAG